MTTNCWKDIKCITCVHGEICMQRLGGTDLTIAVADCSHYKPNIEPIVLPTKFYIVFDVPGFYNIVEYEVERVSYFKGSLDKMWGVSKHSKDVAYAADLGRTVFFTMEEAEAELKKLIEERRNAET